jgi:hypothetical protein
VNIARSVCEWACFQKCMSRIIQIDITCLYIHSCLVYCVHDTTVQISIVEKVTTLQRAGAIAVVIADTGECDKEFKSCGNRIGSAGQGGLSAYDFPETWSEIKIPVVIVTKDTSEKLRKLMEVKKRKFAKLGYQLVNVIDDDDEEDEDEEDEDEEEDEEEEGNGHSEL